jgi:5'-nucleotidase
VALALLGVVDKPIDLVVSGINPNANVGHDVTYSGTVTAAMEAVIGGVRGMAVSLDAPEHYKGALDYAAAARVARIVVNRLLHNTLPVNVLLNVNVPYLKYDEIKGIRVSRQGLRIYRDALIRREDPRGRPYYWIGGEAPTGVPREGTDFGDLQAGYVSVTPIHLDLTAHGQVAQMQSWDWRADEIR